MIYAKALSYDLQHQTNITASKMFKLK